MYNAICVCVLYINLQMLDELQLQRILNDSAVANARSAWIQYVPKIISQAQLEKGVRVSSRCSSLIINESDGELIKCLCTQTTCNTIQ